MAPRSDQFSQYGSKVIPATVRDATYVLDAILDNETELEILEHTTDTAGYTELVFALFDLLGMQFSPRIRDIGDQNIYRADKNQRYKHLEPLFSSTIREERILPLWDDILRVSASIKLGWVTASLLISKLQSYPRQNRLMKALVSYGQLIKSIYIPRYPRKACRPLDGIAPRVTRNYSGVSGGNSIKGKQSRCYPSKTEAFRSRSPALFDVCQRGENTKSPA